MRLDHILAGETTAETANCGRMQLLGRGQADHRPGVQSWRNAMWTWSHVSSRRTSHLQSSAAFPTLQHPPSAIQPIQQLSHHVILPHHLQPTQAKTRKPEWRLFNAALHPLTCGKSSTSQRSPSFSEIMSQPKRQSTTPRTAWIWSGRPVAGTELLKPSRCPEFWKRMASSARSAASLP